MLRNVSTGGSVLRSTPLLYRRFAMLASLGRGLTIATIFMLAACAPSDLSNQGTTTKVPPTTSLPRSPSVTPPALTPLPLQPGKVLTSEINLTTTLPVEPGLQPLVDEAITDLAQRLSID